MGLIVTILLGALVGYLAANLMGRREGFLASVLIGIAGAFVGSVVSRLLGVGDQSALVLDWSNLFWALGGSILVVVLLNTFQNRPNQPRL